MIADLGSFFLQKFDDGEGRRFAQIIDIFLVSHAQDEHASSVHRFLMLVQRSADGGKHVIRHVGIDLSRQFNEAGAEVPFLGLPGQIERIDGDAVSAQAGSGIEGMKAKRLGS